VAELSIFFSEVEIDESETEQRLGTQLSKNKNDYRLSRSGQTELDSMYVSVSSEYIHAFFCTDLKELELIIIHGLTK
jgi:hypothetical protein